jgi:hypothetical protein
MYPRKPHERIPTMATRQTTRSRTRQPEPEPEPQDNGERDYTPYATKPATVTMEQFGFWLLEVTELDGTYREGSKEEAAFLRGVQLGGTLRMDFQRSDWWKDSPDNPRNKEEEPEPEEKPARRGRAAGNGKAATAKPARGRKAPEPEPEVEEEEEEEAEQEAPKATTRRTGRKPAAAKAPAKPATRRGRKPAATAEDDEEVEAPY